MATDYYQIHKKNSEKKRVKDLKIILKKKKTKGGERSKTDIKISLKQKEKRQYHREQNKNLSEEQR